MEYIKHIACGINVKIIIFTQDFENENHKDSATCVKTVSCEVQGLIGFVHSCERLHLSLR